MMTERKFVASKRLCIVMQRTAAHLRAQAARAGFLPDINDNMSDLRRDHMIFDADFLTKFRDRRIIGRHAVELRIKRDPDQLIIQQSEALKIAQRRQKHKAVLSA